MTTTKIPSAATIGSPSNFWLYSSATGFDLTHPPHPSSPPIHPRLTLPTTSSAPIALDPAKTALIVIDMQNFFLSPAFGRDVQGAGHRALKQVAERAVPAARKAGVRVVWVNWGLSEDELERMPPAIKRTFGFEVVGEKEVVKGGGGGGKDAVFGEKGDGVDGEKESGVDVVVEGGKDAKVYKGLGSWCGMLEDPVTGGKVDAGRLLMRDQWNAGLYGPLKGMFEEGRVLAKRPDVWIHKNRMSALWGEKTQLDDFLEREGIRSLLFTGVNTDQCVGGTLQDAFSKGYDCVLLKDGAGTTSPEYAQNCIEYNAGKSWGFVSTCELFADSTQQMTVDAQQ
ncbi:hypothetical protein WHR41_02367 [Cladosporium halotolerans]|uniref:Isochorismatase-like domain-containing protein n=1 Tax=Cladosporium halotolerans TaxID=1052096 RepID=A0AB34KVT4_9PEZI